MKHYYYKIEAYDRKRDRWVKKRDSHITTQPLNIGGHYVKNSVLFRPVKLEMVCENDEIIYSILR